MDRGRTALAAEREERGVENAWSKRTMPIASNRHHSGKSGSSGVA
jgi:hypothetical protein